MFPLLGLASENANFVDGRKKFGYPIKDPIERNVWKKYGRTGICNSGLSLTAYVTGRGTVRWRRQIGKQWRQLFCCSCGSPWCDVSALVWVEVSTTHDTETSLSCQYIPYAVDGSGYFVACPKLQYPEKSPNEEPRNKLIYVWFIPLSN